MGLCRSRALVDEGIRWSTITRRIERGVWGRPHFGVVDTTLQAWTWPRRVVAAVLSCPEGTLASHRTAAGFFDLPGISRGGQIEVTTPRRGRTREALFVVHSSLHPDAGVVREGVPCTGPLRTAIDLARTLDDRAYARVVRELLRRGDLPAELPTMPRIVRLPGYARFAAAFDAEWEAARLRTESPLEDDVVDWLLSRGFDGFVTQHGVTVPVAASDATADYRLDIAWPDRKVVVSVLGARWHADHLARAADAARRRDLEAAGWVVIEVRADDLNGSDADRLAQRLRRALSV